MVMAKVGVLAEVLVVEMAEEWMVEADCSHRVERVEAVEVGMEVAEKVVGVRAEVTEVETAVAEMVAARAVVARAAVTVVEMEAEEAAVAMVVVGVVVGEGGVEGWWESLT